MKHAGVRTGNDTFTGESIIRNVIPLCLSAVVILGIFLTDTTPVLMINELTQAFFRSAFLVLSLLLPVMAGMGLNFSIVLGAMAGQIGIIASISFGMSGMTGLLSAAALAVPIALILGYIAGTLLQRSGGQEMIASIFLGYLANGVYQVIFLVLAGGVIPFAAQLLLQSGSGLRNTIDLNESLKSSLDGVFDGALMLPLFQTLFMLGLTLFAWNVYRLATSISENEKPDRISQTLVFAVAAVFSGLIAFSDMMPVSLRALNTIRFPLITGLLIGGLSVFLIMIDKTPFGESLRIASRESGRHARVGSAVSKTRTAATMISMVLAAWGQIIYLQSTGMMTTYGSHVSVGMMAVVTVLAGGAVLYKASVGQALLGALLIQGFYLTFPVLTEVMGGSGNLTEMLRMIVLNGIILFAIVRKRRN